jgi:hypothetical protein
VDVSHFQLAINTKLDIRHQGRATLYARRGGPVKQPPLDISACANLYE